MTWTANGQPVELSDMVFLVGFFVVLISVLIYVNRKVK